MNRANLQMQTAVSLLLAYLLEQKEFLQRVIDEQKVTDKDKPDSPSGESASHSASSEASLSFSTASGSSRTRS